MSPPNGIPSYTDVVYDVRAYRFNYLASVELRPDTERKRSLTERHNYVNGSLPALLCRINNLVPIVYRR